MTSSASFLIRSILIMSLLITTLLSLGEAADDVRPHPPTKGKRMRVAVLPLDNLSGAPLPQRELRRFMLSRFERLDLQLVDENELNRFMAKQRIRYTGGVDSKMAKGLKEDLGADVVMVTSVELYNEMYLRVSMISRLVSTGDKPEILWMESVGMAGDESPGILGLGLINDFHTLLDKAMDRLTNSLTRYLAEKDDHGYVIKAKSKLDPKEIYNAGALKATGKYKIAIVPFYNESKRRHAGEIMLLHFTRQLYRLENIEVVEPGIIREMMLNMRVIMNQGISNLDIDALTIPLKADFLLSGKVFDYSDEIVPGGTPKIDFSVLMMQYLSRKVVWGSKSYNRGDEGVFFWDWGRINTATDLVSGMVKAVVTEIQRAEPPRAARPVPEKEEELPEFPLWEKGAELPELLISPCKMEFCP
jgi:TolB-like protein